MYPKVGEVPNNTVGQINYVTSRVKEITCERNLWKSRHSEFDFEAHLKHQNLVRRICQE